MKKIFVFGMAVSLLTSCSPQFVSKNNPDAVFKSYKQDIEKKDYEDAIPLLNPDVISERGKTWAKRWVELNSYNVKDIKLEDLSILGGTAKGTVELTYADGKTKKTNMNFIRNNGKWYIAPDFSFKGGSP